MLAAWLGHLAILALKEPGIAQYVHTECEFSVPIFTPKGLNWDTSAEGSQGLTHLGLAMGAAEYCDLSGFPADNRSPQQTQRNDEGCRPHSDASRPGPPSTLNPVLCSHPLLGREMSQKQRHPSLRKQRITMEASSWE